MHVDDVARAVRDGLDRREVEERERVDGVGQLEARDHPAQRRIGARRAVAVVIGQHVQLARELRRERRALGGELASSRALSSA